MREYVLGFAFDHSFENVLLIQKLHPQSMAGKYNGLGGLVEHGEAAVSAMVREFKEECGVTTTAEVWMNFAEMGFVEMSGPDTQVHCFFAELPPEQFEHICSPTGEQVKLFKPPHGTLPDALPEDLNMLGDFTQGLPPNLVKNTAQLINAVHFFQRFYEKVPGYQAAIVIQDNHCTFAF